MNTDLLNSLVTLIVGTFALGIYALTKHHERRSAATIIIMDIRRAEEVVLAILEKGSIDIWTKNVLRENNWSKYKHLFASNFSYDDFAAFNRFFNSCDEMADARTRMREIFYTSLNEKAVILQQKMFSIPDLSSAEGKKNRQALIDGVNNEIYVFDPDEPRTRMLRNLQLMGRLSNTVAYEKLKRLARVA